MTEGTGSGSDGFSPFGFPRSRSDNIKGPGSQLLYAGDVEQGESLPQFGASPGDTLGDSPFKLLP
jgi:hypothetical protein